MIKGILACVKLVPAATEVEMDGQFRLKRDGANLQLNIADLSADLFDLCFQLCRL